MRIQETIGFLVFVTVLVVVYFLEARVLLRFLLGALRKARPKPRLLSGPAVVLHCIALLGVLCFAYGYFVEPYWLEVTRVRLTSGKLRTVSLRIVHISDLHCDRKVRNEPRLPEIINPLEPDLIVFTGDALNTPEALPVFRDTLGKLQAGIGKFAVRGNFDVGRRASPDLFEGTGFRELTAESVKLEKAGEQFCISGLIWTREDLHDLLEDVPDGCYSILLHHHPDLIKEAAREKVDLYLCGHTHGGQVALPLYGAFMTFSKHGKKYEAGLYKVGRTDLYVNRGIGMEGGHAPRVRFCARPEITVIDIAPKR